MNKTNAMRQLDAAKIKYTPCEYEVDENDLSGTHIADCIGLPYEKVFKTIVTRTDKGEIIVFCIPCHKEINLKKAAAVRRSSGAWGVVWRYFLFYGKYDMIPLILFSDDMIALYPKNRQGGALCLVR